MNVEGTTTRRGHRKKLFLRKCGPFLFGITTALFVGILYWLYFDLRQQISDYRQKVEDGKYKRTFLDSYTVLSKCL